MYVGIRGKGIAATDKQDARSVGDLIDAATRQLAKDNQTLEGSLPMIYGRDNIDQRRLGELVDLFNSARFSGEGASKARDLLGKVYEHFLEKFARAEGKVRHAKLRADAVSCVIAVPSNLFRSVAIPVCV